MLFKKQKKSIKICSSKVILVNTVVAIPIMLYCADFSFSRPFIYELPSIEILPIRIV